jgi:hypothetical protein
MGPIQTYLAADHDRLDDLFRRATADPDHVDTDLYAQFRAGLLRHIGLEERILIPTSIRLRGGDAPAMAQRIRLDHGAITALMVPTPDKQIFATLRKILSLHNDLEEKEGGLYGACEKMVGEEALAIARQLQDAPAVPVVAHNDRPGVMDAVRRAVERAGYTMEE